MSDTLRAKLEKHLKGVSAPTLDALATRVWRLPKDYASLAIDLAITLGAVSLRASVELLRAVPDVAPLLREDELRMWADIGNRLAATNPETSVEYFAASPAVLLKLSPQNRLLVLQFVARQAVLSNKTALDSFRATPQVINELADTRLANEVLAICLELARHSVKHSGELLQSAPRVIDHLRGLTKQPMLAHRATALASAFAHRSGGTAADFFAKIPDVIRGRAVDGAAALFDETEIHLERSGSVALQYFVAGGAVMQVAGSDVYARWNALCRKVALQSNAATYHFLKFSPAVVVAMGRREAKLGIPLVAEVFAIVNELAERSPAAAIECFRAAPRALAEASLDQFREWALSGLDRVEGNPRKLQAYYALESRGSRDALTATEGGLLLDSVTQTLRLYVEGLTGHQLGIASLDDVPEESTIGDGSTVYLPAVVTEFADADDNFRLFKVMAAHGAGQIEFGTYERSTESLQAAFATTSDRLRKKGRKAVRHRADFGYADVLKLYPDALLARRIFTTMENGRVDARLRKTYKGIRRDLDAIRDRLFSKRPALNELTLDGAVHEMLMQAAFGGGIRDEGHIRFDALAAEIERIVGEFVHADGARVGDSLVATSILYELVTVDREGSAAGGDQVAAAFDDDGSGEAGDLPSESHDAQPGKVAGKKGPTEQVSHWSRTLNEPTDPDDDMLVAGASLEAPEQDLEPGEVAHSYDEWDRELGDHRVGWCRVVEKRGVRGSRSFVELARSRYAGVISSIRYQFQLMRPEDLRRVRGEIDGEEFDLDAVINYAIDRRAIGRIDERLYTRKLRRRRDVAVSFLLDMSSSTARTISRYPNQPYSHPGRRIIDIEKEGLVLMSEALEAVGDMYSMYGFTSEGRRNVKFHVFKEFSESYSHEVEKRIGGISYQNNTRLGSAIRHASAKLEQQPARTKLLVVLSDGRPYDHDYGDSRYAREDTKMALRHAKRSGVTPFCITIDRESEDQLKDMYGEVGYTIIDDVLSLPERMPGIYRRLTT